MTSFLNHLFNTHWGEFSFARPWILLGLLVLPLFAWLKGRFGGTPGVLFSSIQPFLNLGKERRARAGGFLASFFYLAMGLFIVALARPQLGQTTQHVKASGIDIMLVLDVSGSMSTEDYTIGNQRASRLEAVKRVTEQFIEARPNDRIGIIAFAGRSYLVSPITLDHEWLIDNLDRVQLGLVEDGTAIGSALASAAARLKNRNAKTKLIVLLTDGANNAGKIMPLTAAEAAKAVGIRIYTVGAGSSGPVSVPVQDRFGRTFYQTVIFDFDEKLLADIAKIGDGKYFRAADSASLDKTFQEIDRLEKTKIEIEKNVNHRDFFWWLIALGALLLVMETLLSQTLWRKIP
ncbi:MAG: VWA domain-containing protein [Chthoniobacterales bacterium]|nr:VWA domain-containing protein [Chthoniobacterales bacterium]